MIEISSSLKELSSSNFENEKKKLVRRVALHMNFLILKFEFNTSDMKIERLFSINQNSIFKWKEENII